MGIEDVIDNVARVLECKQAAVRAVRYNVDGNYCMTCGSDKSLKLWNPMTGVLLKTYSGHGYEVLDCRGSCDNGQMCSCGMDKTVILWDVASGKVLRKYRGHAGQVNCVEFNEESTVIFSGSVDGTMRAWDSRSRKNDPIQIMPEFKDGVTSIAVSDHEILAGSADGRVRRYDLRMGELYVDLIDKMITCVNFTRDGQCTLVSSQDSSVKLLDKDSGEMLNEFVGHKHVHYKIESCLNHKDTHVLSGSEDGKLYVWDLVEAKIVKALEVPNTRVCHSLSHHPTRVGLLVASGSKVIVTDLKEQSSS